jgi:hypothetical protein
VGAPRGMRQVIPTCLKSRTPVAQVTHVGLRAAFRLSWRVASASTGYRSRLRSFRYFATPAGVASMA